MNTETVQKIMDAMQSGMNQSEAQKFLGISRNTIGKICRKNGYLQDKSEIQRKAYAKFEAKQIELFGEKPKVIKPVQRVTTSHVRLPSPDKWSGEEFILNAF